MKPVNMNLSFLPTKVRGVFYGVVAILTLLVLSAQKGFEAINQDDPTWLSFGAGAVNALAVAVSTLALSNLTPTAKPEAEPSVLQVVNPNPEIVVPSSPAPDEAEPADDPLELEAPEADEVDPGDTTNTDSQ